MTLTLTLTHKLHIAVGRAAKKRGVAVGVAEHAEPIHVTVWLESDPAKKVTVCHEADTWRETREGTNYGPFLNAVALAVVVELTR